jgi:transketolase
MISQLAACIRALTMDAVEKAQSGHPGMPMGMADVATVLFTEFMQYYGPDPRWPNRDRFILSAGHGSMLLYSLLYLTGNPFMSLEEIKNFRCLHSRAAGHPEADLLPGVEATTGMLGQGLAMAVGMALAERMLAADFPEFIDHYTYVMAGDGCLMEGVSHEAASLAGHLQLGRLIVLFDDNHISIDGPTSLTCSDNHPQRFAALGWHTVAIDGHNPQQIRDALQAAKADPRPSLIACRTQIGYGAPNKQGTATMHGTPLGADEIAAARAFLQWPHAPFVIPEDLLSIWRAAGKRHQAVHDQWQQLYAQKGAALKQRFESVDPRAVPTTALEALRQKYRHEQPKLATRQVSGEVLATVVPQMPALVGGSADLTPSNNTFVKQTQVVARGNLRGKYIHYGEREHGMAALMNGLALYGGFIPYGGTFLVFSDYLRPALRLSALMKVPVIYVMTHDSIGLGEDGPTHQPVEHLASLRAMPNLRVYRPADAEEVVACWQHILEHTHEGPAVIALSRQGLPALTRTQPTSEFRGGYVVTEPQPSRQITLMATGSEVHLATHAAEVLAQQGIGAAVVSLPCWETFLEQTQAYQEAVLGPWQLPRLGIEAAADLGWHKFLKPTDRFIGMRSFGASAPYLDLYRHFGITVENIVDQALALCRVER